MKFYRWQFILIFFLSPLRRFLLTKVDKLVHIISVAIVLLVATYVVKDFIRISWNSQKLRLAYIEFYPYLVYTLGFILAWRKKFRKQENLALENYLLLVGESSKNRKEILWLLDLLSLVFLFVLSNIVLSVSMPKGSHHLWVLVWPLLLGWYSYIYLDQQTGKFRRFSCRKSSRFFLNSKQASKIFKYRQWLLVLRHGFSIKVILFISLLFKLITYFTLSIHQNSMLSAWFLFTSGLLLSWIGPLVYQKELPFLWLDRSLGVSASRFALSIRNSILSSLILFSFSIDIVGFTFLVFTGHYPVTANFLQWMSFGSFPIFLMPSIILQIDPSNPFIQIVIHGVLSLFLFIIIWKFWMGILMVPVAIYLIKNFQTVRC